MKEVDQILLENKHFEVLQIRILIAFIFLMQLSKFLETVLDNLLYKKIEGKMVADIHYRTLSPDLFSNEGEKLMIL